MTYHILAKLRARRKSRISLSAPDVNLSGGLFFWLLPFFFLSTARFKSPGPYIELPTNSNVCTKGLFPDEGIGTISIDSYGRVFFAIDEKYRTALMQHVGAKYGIQFTPSQLAGLSKMPFLAMDIRQLPTYLSSTQKQQQKFVKNGIPFAADNNQLSEYIASTISIVHSIGRRKPTFFIEADERLTSPHVQHLISQLQQHNVNRVNLATNMEMRDSALFF